MAWGTQTYSTEVTEHVCGCGAGTRAYGRMCCPGGQECYGAGARSGDDESDSRGHPAAFPTFLGLLSPFRTFNAFHTMFPAGESLADGSDFEAAPELPVYGRPSLEMIVQESLVPLYDGKRYPNLCGYSKKNSPPQVQ